MQPLEKEAGGRRGCKLELLGQPGSMSTRLLETGLLDRPQLRGRLRLCPHGLLEPLNPAMPEAPGLVSFSINTFPPASVSFTLVF